MYREWQHAFKMDPAKDISDEAIETLCDSGTDAIIIGGSQDITLDGVLDMLSRVRRYSVPCVLEVSTLESITPGFDGYLIPSVLNSTSSEWIVGLHRRALEQYGGLMDWDELLLEGYCILNPDCTAAKLTKADTSLTESEVESIAMMAGQLWKMPVFYLEYSGMFGDVNVLKTVKNALRHSETRLFYGGGIRTPEQAEQVAQYADTVIVGNICHEDPELALQTVQAVKQCKNN
ncbi:heptaprenylglyceryl phosphate synthase [Bacillaceae bacterium SIJ1]|uniref:heptaprenylglyceryl phosphate synthase n=1 Tax=Litoribacterium kuwaitense TaxID=1398745 RepID=UPI0013EDB03F|nr:heptaprenylglyceryl phosphate synthase [Litoribacterium kuwaitense]NGP46081.1 heptaprenylglyceryl phosphate synthase [Litoribacterium kuwaitense]